MKNLNWLILLLALGACSHFEEDKNFNKLVSQKPYTALMFIAPDCPLCITLSTPYSELSERYPNIQFLAVMSGSHYEAMEINMYATKTKLKPRIYRDYDYSVARQLKAAVTPEFFVLDSTSNILYSGMMDDRILTLGSYKQVWDKHYLKEALDAVRIGKAPSVSRTEPIGCILEY
ncbi:MAG: hypothetical protein ACPGTP_02225 [Bacteroidia bacterium]